MQIRPAAEARGAAQALLRIINVGRRRCSSFAQLKGFVSSRAIATPWAWVSPESVFKGQVEGAFTLLTRGGKVGFPDGSSAQILTIETDSIKVNGQYLFFLVPVNAARKEFRSTNGVEGIILLSMAENSVRSLAGNTADANLHPIIGELRGLSVSSLLGKVRSTIAAGAADGR